MQWQGFVDIAAPVERVYSYLADFLRHCEWAQTVERLELTKPGSSDGVGAVYKTFERQALHSDRPPEGSFPERAKKETTSCEVTELQPNRRIAWSAHPTPITFGVQSNLAFDFRPAEPGGTRLTQTIEVTQPKASRFIYSRLMHKEDPDRLEEKLRDQFQASLENIKTIVEESPR